MNRPQRDRNPINLMFMNQPEAVTRDDDGFAIFPTDPAGWRAAHHQIELDQDRNLTLRTFIFKFAPPEENDANAYLVFICKELQVGPEIKLKDLSKYSLAGVMAAYEGYFAV